MEPEREVWRAEKARQLLEDEMIKGALDEIENAALENMLATPMEAVLLREKLWMMLGVVRKFRSIFQTHLETGKLAQAMLTDKAERESMREKFKRWMP